MSYNKKEKEIDMTEFDKRNMLDYEKEKNRRKKRRDKERERDKKRNKYDD